MNVPTNRDCEIGIIGACLDGGIETCITAFDMVPDRAFFSEDLRLAYEVLRRLVSRGESPETIGMMSEWKRIGPGIDYPLADLAGAQETHRSYMLKARAETVLDCYRRRSALMAADTLRTAACDFSKPIDESLSEYETALGETHSKAPPILEPKQTATQLLDDLEKRYALNGAMSGFSTGFPEWDRMTDGLQPSEFWVIGARPNVGKTALALNVAESVSIIGGVPSLFVSLEMSAVAISRRLLSMNAHINGSSIRRGQFTETEFKSCVSFQSRFSTSPFYILDSPGGIRVGQLCNSIRAAIRRFGIKVVFIDYLQKIRPDKKGEKRTYELGDTTSALVELTKRERINMFTLAQLNRDHEKGQRAPVLSDLADSKSIEADADFVGLLDRPVDGDEKRAQLIVAKQRDGERGKVMMDFQGWHCRFTPVARIAPHN